MKQKPISQKSKLKNRALRLLSVRNYTANELRQRLVKDDYDPEEIEAVLAWLKEIDYLDDQRTAELFVENRNRFRPTGKYGLKQELKQKGVSDTIIDTVVNTEDDDYELALRLAKSKLKTMQHVSPQKQYQRIGGLLGRRGFSWDVIRNVLNSLFSSFLDMDL